ncbi:MAG: nucleotide exchange factor GrpE [Chitinispirillia bacterium]|nr:nucleotide exchange factor GrpE [Chitinispirillia bacterium]MCL2269490.1 nucleotide exchange factor GrpE [Chitinispirillia bacterium]
MALEEELTGSAGNKPEPLPDEILDDQPDDVDAILNEISESSEFSSSLTREVEEAKDRYLRLMAEFDNYKRRAGREYERLVQSANEKLMLEIIDVRENFERALKSGESGGGDFAVFFDGMKMIFAKFEEVLGRNGLTVFAEPGEVFDPMVHDALMNSPHPEIPADHIAQVFERGYRLKDKVVKHARVIVSSGAPAVDAGAGESGGDQSAAGQPSAGQPSADQSNGGQ